VTLQVAQIVVGMFEAYALVGLAFALIFLPRAVARLDPGMAKAPKTLRAIILPGIVALWPLFAWRWIRRATAPIERTAHRVLAGGSHVGSRDAAS
jgi:hypothetical protein